MKTIKLFFLLTVLFCLGSHLFGQPGESDKKNNIHEIKLYEREDGSKVGALAWSTASPDSIQKFVVRNLSIMEPVQVILQALSPNDEITLQFVKEKWDQPESSIAAKGKDIGKKIFRTYKTAAMKISAKKAGIPYLIFVQVGKKFPANKAPLFRITNNKDEYDNYLKNKGETGKNKADTDSAVIPLENNENSGGNTTSNSSLLYIIIGLLSLMVAILVYFVFIRKGGKKTLLFLLLFGLGFNLSSGQSDSPAPLSTDQINQLFGYNDNLRDPTEPEPVPIVEEGTPEWYEHMSREWGIPIEPGPEPMTETEFKEMVYEMREEFREFQQEFVDEMPGVDTEGGNRAIPPGTNEAELNRLRNRVQRLEAQVEFLSDRDRSHAPEENNQEPILVLCIDVEACVDCIERYAPKIDDLVEKFRKLNRIIIQNNWEMEVGIDTGNNLANMAPGMSLGWQRQLIAIQNARRGLWIKYHDKYKELMNQFTSLINSQKNCHDTYNPNGDYDTNRIFSQSERYIKSQAPELITPMF